MAAALPIVAMAGMQLLSARSSSQQADYAAEQADANAAATRAQTAAREDIMRRQMGLALGEQRAAAAQSGFLSTEGSFAGLLSESKANTELDVLTSRYEGQLRALSFENEAASARAQAKQAKRQGWLNAASTLAQGAQQYGAGLKMTQASGLKMPQGGPSYGAELGS